MKKGLKKLFFLLIGWSLFYCFLYYEENNYFKNNNIIFLQGLLIVFLIALFYWATPLVIRRISAGHWFATEEENKMIEKVYQKADEQTKVAYENLPNFFTDVLRKVAKPLIIIFTIFLGSLFLLYFYFKIKGVIN
jgi:hypothetical protein